MSQSLSKVLGALTTQKDGHSSSRSPLGIMDHQVLCPPATDLEAVEACEKYLETLVTKLTDPEEARALRAAEQLGSAADLVSTKIFLKSFPNWLSKLLPLIQNPTDNAALDGQRWQCLTSVFVRVADVIELASVRKEASQYARECAHFILKSTNEGQSGFQNKHLKLLSVLLSAVGPALKGQINTLEKICFSSLLSESASSAQRLGFSQILALLPQASGDSASWTALANKILKICGLVLHGVLLDPDTHGNQDWQKLPEEIQDLVGERQWISANANGDKMCFWISIIAGFLDCLEHLMTHPQPFPVSLPGSNMFDTLWRIFLHRHDADNIGKTGIQASAHLEFHLAFPGLKIAALRLLQLWFRVGRTALTPYFYEHLSQLSQILTNLRIKGEWTQPSSLRKEMYEAAAQAIDLVGPGSVSILESIAKSCVIGELLQSGATKEVEQSPISAKKKRKMANGSAEKITEAHELYTLTGNELASRLKLEEACSSLLSALLRTGGPQLSQEERLPVDLLILHIVQNSARRLETCYIESFSSQHAKLCANHHLIVLKSLHCAVLAPSQIRPVILPQAIIQYEKGLCSRSKEISSWCKEALLGCNSLLHPRQGVDHNVSDSSPQPTINGALSDFRQTISQIGGTVPVETQATELPSSEQWHRVELQIDENPLKDIRREKDQYKTQSEKQSVGLQRKSAKTVTADSTPGISSRSATIQEQDVENDQELQMPKAKKETGHLMHQAPSKGNSFDALGGKNDHSKYDLNPASGVVSEKMLLVESDSESLPEIDIGSTSSDDDN